MRCFIAVIILFISLSYAQAQTDLGSWSSVSLSKKINKFTVIAKPTIRHNQNLSNHTNTSIDVIAKRKFDDHWSASFLERYWWLENGVNRNFWFMDVSYAFAASEKVGISQYLRWHLAQDIEIDDPNFLRYHPAITINTQSKFTPFFASEVFFRLDGINTLQRTRLKLGGTYRASDHIKVVLRLWREDFINVTNPRVDYIIEFSFDYNL